MHVEGLLGQRARAHLQHHRRAFAGSVIILLDAVDHALTGGEVHHPLAADRMSNRAALGRVFALGFNGDGVVPEDVQVAFGIGLLKELAALRGRRDRIKNAGVGDARLGVIRDKLVSIGGNPNAGKASSSHEFLSVIAHLVTSMFFAHSGRPVQRTGSGLGDLQRPHNGPAIRWGSSLVSSMHSELRDCAPYCGTASFFLSVRCTAFLDDSFLGLVSEGKLRLSSTSGGDNCRATPCYRAISVVPAGVSRLYHD